MNFKQLFNSLLLEEIQNTSSGGNPVHQQTSGDDLGSVLDNGTDPDEMLTQGLKASVEAVQQDFNKRMTTFAKALSPEAIKMMTIGRLKKEINDVFKYIDGIQVFAKSKIDALAQNPSAILAAFIASDPAKQSAFENLHKKLEEFKKSLEEIDGGLSTLKGQIDEFVDDVSQDEGESIERMAGQSQGGTPSFGGVGQGSSSGGVNSGQTSLR